MITSSTSPVKRSGMPNQLLGVLLHSTAISGRSCVRPELSELTVVPAPTPHPVQMHRQLPGHGYLRDLPPAPHRDMEELTAPLRLTAHRDLRRFHQQIAKQGVALFADVSQSTP